MRGIRIATLCSLAVAASGAIAVTNASAALPEVGRCVKVGFSGAYKYKGCVVTDPSHNGAWEWQPGPGAKPKWEAPLIGEVNLETVGKKRVHCGPSELLGEWTGAKTATVNVAFHGCQETATKYACTTLGSGKESEVKNEQPLAGEIGFISGKGTEKPKVGIDLKSNSALPMLSFTCGPPPTEPGTTEAWNIEGSVIGELKPIDVMKTEGKAVFLAVNGKQIPEKFEEGVKDVPIAKYGSPTPSTTEEAGLTLREEHKTIVTESEEPLEIKAK